jgi:hypothetical protein
LISLADAHEPEIQRSLGGILKLPARHTAGCVDQNKNGHARGRVRGDNLLLALGPFEEQSTGALVEPEKV